MLGMLQKMRDVALAGHFHGMTVAVKIAELTAPRGQAKAQLTEAKIATSLQHPNVVSCSLPNSSAPLNAPRNHVKMVTHKDREYQFLRLKADESAPSAMAHCVKHILRGHQGSTHAHHSLMSILAEHIWL